MAGKPHWTEDSLVKGVKNYELSSWKYYLNFINKEMLDYTDYVYRGHACRTWKLEPTIDRIIKDPESPKREMHLSKFKFETRGRRGAHPPQIKDDNDWWALGQHHGLATPLLDWTESPFVALFFAANTALNYKSDYITITALALSAIDERN
ncbi:MAG: FRG domain-containing protein, partial [Bacteroidetes bacterium]